MKTLNVKRSNVVLSVFLITLVCVFYFIYGTKDTLVMDEAISLNWVRLPFNEMMRTLIEDVHPPLHYLALRLWLAIFGDNIFAARAFAFTGLLGILLLSISVYKRFGLKCASWYLFAASMTPYMGQKSTEVRMYMHLTFFVILCGLSCYQIIARDDTPRSWWILCYLSGILTAYTQYMGLLLIVYLYAGMVIFLLLTRNWAKCKKWLLLAFACVISYLPWLPYAYAQVTTVSGGFWIQNPDSRLSVIKDLFYSEIPYSEYFYLLMLVGFPLVAVVLLVFHLCKSGKSGMDTEAAGYYWSVLCMSGIWVLWAFSFVYLNIFGHYIFLSRYFICAYGLFALGSIYVVKKLPAWIPALLILVLCIIWGVRARTFLKAEPKFETSRTAEVLVKEANDIPLILLEPEEGNDTLFLSLQYYVPNATLEYGTDDFAPADENYIYLSTSGTENDYTADSELLGDYHFSNYDLHVYEHH